MQNADYELAFCDDSVVGYMDAESLVREYDITNYKIYSTSETWETKNSRGYSIFGSLWNTAVVESDADLGIMLCDDDCLYPNYLEQLATWFSDHPTLNFCYSHVLPFNPFIEAPEDVPSRPCYLNHTHPLHLPCVCDASQVAWRLPEFKRAGMKFIDTRTKNIDEDIFHQMNNEWGLCNFSGLIAQYKGFYPNTLTYRPDPFNPPDL